MEDSWIYYIVIFMSAIFGLVIYDRMHSDFWFSYDLYKQAYSDYQRMIVRKHYPYERFCDYFMRTCESLHLKGDRNDKFQCLVDLIKSESPLLHKYFQNSSFRKNDYVKLLDEYNKMPNAHQLNNKKGLLPIQQKRELYFIDLLVTLDEEQKQVLCSKMYDSLHHKIKPGEVASIILALQRLEYIRPTIDTKALHRSIIAQFGVEIGTYEAILSALKKKAENPFYNNTIETLMKYFKCD